MPSITCAVCSHNFEASDDANHCPNCGAESGSSASEETTVPTTDAMGQPLAGGAVAARDSDAAEGSGSGAGSPERAAGDGVGSGETSGGTAQPGPSVGSVGQAGVGAAGAAAGAGAGGGAGGPGGPPTTGGAAGGWDGGPTPGGAHNIPFEDRSQPFFQRLLATIGLAFSDPRRLFTDMRSDDLGPPVVYFVLVQSVVTLAAIAWQMLFAGVASMVDGQNSLGGLAVGTGMMIIYAVFAPVFLLIGLFFSAGIYHVCLMVLGDGQGGFGITLRAVAYGGTPNVLAIIPVCGWIISGPWVLVLTIMAAYYGHRTDGWRVIVAYFLPTILCCCLLGWLLSSLGLLAGLGGLSGS